MKPRTTITRASKKRLAANGGKVPFSSISGPRKPVRKHARKPSETLRIYGTLARRKWMKTLPCSACGVVGYSEGAHVLGNGGMSRKADADTQAPLCGPHPYRYSTATFFDGDARYIGCHKLYDDYRWIFDRKFPDFNPERAAAETERLWREALACSAACTIDALNQPLPEKSQP